MLARTGHVVPADGDELSFLNRERGRVATTRALVEKGRLTAGGLAGAARMRADPEEWVAG